MQCNYNSFIQIINFHGLFRNALRCRKTGACRILVPLRYTMNKNTFITTTKDLHKFLLVPKMMHSLAFFFLGGGGGVTCIVNSF